MEALIIPKMENGLTPLLSKSLDSQALARHRATVAFELEVLSKKVDRFGWERDRNTPAHDRVMLDWMNALQDYPLDEIQAACRAAVMANPNKMPNEGHIKAEILKARHAYLIANPAPKPQETPKRRVSKERAAEILAEAGFAPKRMGAGYKFDAPTPKEEE